MGDLQTLNMKKVKKTTDSEHELVTVAKKFNKHNKDGKLTPKITHVIVPFIAFPTEEYLRDMGYDQNY